MNFQKDFLPEDAKFVRSTPTMTEKTVFDPILKKHMAPRNQCGYLVVEKGALQFVWEDTGETLDAAPEHPIVIFPERYHHVQLTGPVTFRIEFYDVPQDVPQKLSADPTACRPGETFFDKTRCGT